MANLILGNSVSTHSVLLDTTLYIEGTSGPVTLVAASVPSTGTSIPTNGNEQKTVPTVAAVHSAINAAIVTAIASSW